MVKMPISEIQDEVSACTCIQARIANRYMQFILFKNMKINIFHFVINV
jgi:hypothetical protein